MTADPTPDAAAYRAVNPFTGEVAERPSAFFRALEAVDSTFAELEALRDENAELRVRVDELTQERDILLSQRDERWHLVEALTAQLATARAERDEAKASLQWATGSDR